MLERTPISPTILKVQTPAPQQSLPRRRPVTTISALTLARAGAYRSAADRTALAVQWMRGWLEIAGRTQAMAGLLFHVHQTAVSRALSSSTDAAATPAESLAFHWERTSDADRDRFVRRHLVSVWDSLDRVTR
jgi:hypothetical protein